VGWSPNGMMIEEGKTTDIIAGSVSNGVATVNAYAFTAYDLPNGLSTLLDVSDVSGTQSDGVTTIFFTRPIHTGFQPISESTESYVIGAYSQTNDPSLSYHGNTHALSAIQVNFYTGGTSRQAVGIKDAHAILMFVSWGLILPIGVFCARYLRSFPEALWFKLHRPLQYGGFVVALAGIILGYFMVGSNQFRVLGHAILGTIILALSLAQVVVAFFRPHKELNEPTTSERFAFEIFHHWNGRILVLLAIVQIFLGIYAIGYDIFQPWIIPTYAAIVGIPLLSLFIVEIINCIRPFGKITPCLECFENTERNDEYVLAFK